MDGALRPILANRPAWATNKAVGVVAALGVGLRLFLSTNIGGQIGFNTVMMSSCMPPYFLTLFGSLYTERGTEVEKKRKRASFAKVVITTAAICWRAALAICFWVKLELDGLSTIRREFGKTGRPLCFIGNHTSFLDIFLSVAVLPLSKVGKVKMIVSSHVFKMPIIGRLSKSMGHLAVPFKDTAGSSSTFEVDKEKLVGVMESFEEHLKRGEACAWFPEGQVNRGDCSKLQLFRAGGLGIAVRNDVELWSFTMVGNALCWPGSAPIGGNPSRIGGKLECICESTNKLLAFDEAGKDDRDKAIYLAGHTQKLMQNNVDAYIAKGFKAGDNTRKTR